MYRESVGDGVSSALARREQAAGQLSQRLDSGAVLGT
jgi:hypothetical protein